MLIAYLKAMVIFHLGNVRFFLLVLTLVMTAVIVTVVMFRTLYLLLG